MLTPVSPSVSLGILNSSAGAQPVKSAAEHTEPQAVLGQGVSTPSAIFIRSERYEALQQTSAVDSSTNVFGADTEVSPLSGSTARIQETTNTILGFIEAQLKRDMEGGATAEELASRLQAGLEGVKLGFTQASQQLEEMGLMTPELNQELQLTFDNLLSGSEALQDQFVEGAAAADSAINVDRDFSFSLITKDGITADIQVLSNQDGLSQSILNQLQGVEALLDYSKISDRYSLSATESLPEGDLASVASLLDQFSGISEKFQHSGGPEAFEYARSLGYDRQEISQFIQGLNHPSAHRLQQTYGQVQSLAGTDSGNMSHSLKSLADFALGLQQSLEMASVFQQPEELLMTISEAFDRGDARLQQLTASLLAKQD